MWCKSYGVTQLMLAQALSVSRSAAYMWSCGERNPSRKALADIAKYVHKKTKFFEKRVDILSGLRVL